MYDWFKVKTRRKRHQKIQMDFIILWSLKLLRNDINQTNKKYVNQIMYRITYKSN